MRLSLWLRIIVVSFFAIIFSMRFETACAAEKSVSVELQNFLVIPDIHTNSNETSPIMQINPSGPETGLKNNLDHGTFVELMSKITDGISNGTVATPEFVIFLGDMVHNGDDDDPPSRVADENSAFALLKNTFPTIPIFYVFGNHDSVHQVWGPFYDTTPGAESPHSPYEVAKNNGWSDGFLSTGTMCSSDKNFSTPCLIYENTQYGYYSAYLKPHLRMIALNTPMLDTQAIGTTAAVANAQLDWFDAQMRIAVAHGDSVMLAMHVPLGSSLDSEPENKLTGALPAYETRMLQTIANYHENIIGMIAAHTHMDSMRIFTQTTSTNRVGFLINPAALSTRSGNAPSFKTIYFSQQGASFNDWVLTDYDTFNFIENDVRKNNKRSFELQKLYNFNDYYCGGTATSINACLGNITVDKMNLYHTAGNPNYFLDIVNPQNVFIALPPVNIVPPTPAKNESNANNFGTIAAAVAGTAALVGGIAAVEGTSQSPGV
jgi:sphingomyelin phosphodiesterase acid-like 3